MARTRQRPDSDTASRILDVAERLLQTRGFNGFSYADVAAELKITKASLHYHFRGKADLGEALVVRYATRFAQKLALIDSGVPDPRGKLDAYAALYAEVLRAQRMCLCGMLAAEYQTLPGPMRTAVVRFFDDSEAWLTSVLERGHADETLRLSGSASETARLIMSGLEGAMLVARPYDDLARFEQTASTLLAGLAQTAPQRAR